VKVFLGLGYAKLKLFWSKSKAVLWVTLKGKLGNSNTGLHNSTTNIEPSANGLQKF